MTAEEERAAVVAWLREVASRVTIPNTIRTLADAIEARAHLRGEGE